MSEVISYERVDEIGVITINNPPVNAMSQAVRQGIWEVMDTFNNDADAQAAVLMCAGRTFVAGADITEFDQPPKDPWLPGMIAKMEQSPKLLVAAIHGTALGGGFETTFGCHYRCALATARVGQPEVNLGLLPGAGGTQRLPRLIGVTRALDMILTGQAIPAEQARDWGAIDEIIAGDLRQGAIEYARRLLSENAPIRRVSELAVNADDVDAEFFIDRHKEIGKKYRGFFAPVQILNCIEAAVNMPFAEAMDLERELFEECKASPHSRAQRYLFFANRSTVRIPDVPKDTVQRDIRRIAVVGAGTMGSGIAMSFINAGFPVTLLETSQEALDRGLEKIRSTYAADVEKGRLTGAQLDASMDRVTPAVEYAGIADADLVVETVIESMAVKQQVFKKLDEVCKQEALLATNTSTLDINEIAAVTGRPESILGMHFFAPANIIDVLELVRAEKTSREAIATAMSVAKRLGKVAVPVGVCFGFVANRIFIPYLREAQLMLLEGVAPERIDQVAYDWGMAIGPNAVLDRYGIDVYNSLLQRWKDKEEDPAFCRMLTVLSEMGRLGQKTGAGFYKYAGGDPVADPEVARLVRREAVQLGIKQREIGDEEIIERLFYSMINEGTRVLEEGIALRSGDIDVIFTGGYGWPNYRGGPMLYGDITGLKQVYGAICHYRKLYGDRYWTPASLLDQLAASGGTFEEWSRAR